MERLLAWSRAALWPVLLIVVWWSWGVERDWRFHALVVLLVFSAVFMAWWQKRLYLVAITMLFVGMVGMLSYLQYLDAGGVGVLVIYVALCVLLWLSSLTAFQTYLLSPRKPVVFAYIAAVVFICLELFWLLAMLAADPTVRSAIVISVFHILFAMIALNEWQKLNAKNFRFYLVSLALLITVFLRLM